MVRSAEESDGLRGLALEFDRFQRGGIVVDGDFVAVLIAALIDDLLHLGGSSFGKRKGLDRLIVAFSASSDLGDVGVKHKALKLDRTCRRLGLYGIDNDWRCGVDNDRDNHRDLSGGSRCRSCQSYQDNACRWSN